MGPKFDTDSRGLSPKATGLHITGVGEDTLGSTLALPASWAEVEGSNGGPQNFGLRMRLQPDKNQKNRREKVFRFYCWQRISVHISGHGCDK